MGSSVRCPYCLEEFYAAASSAEVLCPACGEGMSPGASAPPRIGRKSPAAPAGVGGAPGVPPSKGGKTGRVSLTKACPACGVRYPGEQNACPSCGANYRMAKGIRTEETEGPLQPEKAGIRAGVLGGVAMVAIAAIWFFAGLAADRIFFYPPILAVIGIYAIIKGIAEGNLAGKEKVPPRRRG